MACHHARCSYLHTNQLVKMQLIDRINTETSYIHLNNKTCLLLEDVLTTVVRFPGDHCS